MQLSRKRKDGADTTKSAAPGKRTLAVRKKADAQSGKQLGKGDHIGLDIGASGVKVAVIRDGHVLRIATQPLPVGVIEHGYVVKPKVIAKELKALWKRERVPAKDVHVTFSCADTQTRTVLLPDPNDERELYSEAELAVPMEFPELDLDKIVWRYTRGRKLGMMTEVHLTVMPATAVEQLLKAVKAAGLKVKSLQDATIAAVRVYETTARPVWLLSIGASLTTLALVRNGRIVFARSMPGGGNQITQSYIDAGICADWSAAEYLKRGVSLIGRQIGSFDQALVDQAASATLFFSDDIATRVHELMITKPGLEANEATPDEMWVIGGGSLLDGMPDVLESTMNLRSVRAPAPRKWYRIGAPIGNHAAAIGAPIPLERIDFAHEQADATVRKHREELLEGRRSGSRSALVAGVAVAALALLFSNFALPMVIDTKAAQQESLVAQDELTAAQQASSTKKLKAPATVTAAASAISSLHVNRLAWGRTMTIVMSEIALKTDVKVASMAIEAPPGPLTITGTASPAARLALLTELNNKGVKAQFTTDEDNFTLQVEPLAGGAQ